MDKTAENERIKLKAMYFNNISVGLLIAGCLVPYLAFIQKAGEFVDWLLSSRQFTFSEVTKDIMALLAMLLAFYGARYFHRAADKEISKIKIERNAALVSPSPSPCLASARAVFEFASGRTFRKDDFAVFGQGVVPRCYVGDTDQGILCELSWLRYGLEALG